MQDTDLIEKVAHIDERAKSNTKRLNEHDSRIDNLEKTYSIMEKMNYRMENVENNVSEIKDDIQKSKEQKNIQPTKGDHKMVTCQNYVSLFYCQITSCPSDGGIS